MKKNHILFILFLMFLMVFIPVKSNAFTKIVDLVFDGKSVDPLNISGTLETIKENKIKNKKIKNPRKKLPTELTRVEARQADPKNIQLEIDTSEVVLKSKKDIQLPISNTGFLNAIQETLGLIEGVDIADIKFKPLKFSTVQVNSEDGRNVVTFRPISSPPGVSANTAIFTIVNFALTDTVEFKSETIMVKPGTILDADIIFDPTDDSCLAYFTTMGNFKIGGDDSATVSEGGFDADLAEESCKDNIGVAEVVEFAIKGLYRLLGFETPAIVSDATGSTPVSRVRYALNNDDKIALANLYPNTSRLTNHGSISGKVFLDKKAALRAQSEKDNPEGSSSSGDLGSMTGGLPLNRKVITGAHVVLEDTLTGEPVCSTFTNFDGSFEIKAVPAGTYNVYAEPLDGPAKPIDFLLNVFALVGNTDFTSTVLEEPVEIEANKKTNVEIEVNEKSRAAFNINPQVDVLTELEYIGSGSRAAFLPIKIMPGEMISDLKFWGDNISQTFGTLSVSGPGLTISNVEDKHIPISPKIECAECEDKKCNRSSQCKSNEELTTEGKCVKCTDKKCKRDSRCAPTEELIKEADQIPGIEVDINCASGTAPGPRNIIFSGDMLESTHPSFGFRDQLTGGIIVTE